MSRFLTDKLEALEPYTPGEQPKDRTYIKLNTNESPFPPSPEAIRLAREEAARLMLYPDPECTALAEALAKELSVKPENVVFGNGSDEVLNFATMAYCDADTPAIFPDITYGFYKVFAAVNGVPYLEIPLAPDFTVRAEDYVGRRGTVFIANPNAPTGIPLPLSEIERILKSDPDRVVVIDEAYIDFGGESAVPLTKKYKNLLVTGTFSKSRSMAGARLGFAVGDAELISDLQRIRYSQNPYNVNRMTMAAGLGALADGEYFRKNVSLVKEAREWCQRELCSLGFDMTPSAANFIFATSDRISGEELYLALKARGVLVRHFKNPRICEYNRITVGSIEEMHILVDKIKEILEERK